MKNISPSFFDPSNASALQIASVDHIAIAVPSLDEAIAWYRSALGFVLVERRLTKGAETSMISAVIRSGNVVIVLIQGIEPDSQVTRFIRKFGPGVQHIAFAVENLRKCLTHIEQCGAKSDTGILEGDGIWQAFLQRDHKSGVRVELIERRGGEFSDSSVEQLFRRMEADNLV